MLYLPLDARKLAANEDKLNLFVERENRIAMVEALKAQPIVISHNRPGGYPSPALSSYVRDYQNRCIGGRI